MSISASPAALTTLSQRPSLSVGEFSAAAGGVRRVSQRQLHTEAAAAEAQKLPGELRQVRRLGRSLVRRNSVDPPPTPRSEAEVAALSRKNSSMYLHVASGGTRSRSQSIVGSAAPRAARPGGAAAARRQGHHAGGAPDDRDRQRDAMMHLNEYGELTLSLNTGGGGGAGGGARGIGFGGAVGGGGGDATSVSAAADRFLAREYTEAEFEKNPSLRRLRDIYKKVKLAESIVRGALPAKPSRVRTDQERQRDLLELEKAKLILFVGRRYNIEKRIGDMLDEVAERQRFVAQQQRANASGNSRRTEDESAYGGGGAADGADDGALPPFEDADGAAMPRARLAEAMQEKINEINAEFLCDRSEDDFNMAKIRTVIETIEREVPGVAKEHARARQRCADAGVDVDADPELLDDHKAPHLAPRELILSMAAAAMASDGSGGKGGGDAKALGATARSRPTSGSTVTIGERRRSANINEALKHKDFYVDPDKRVGELLDTVSNFKDMCWLIESLDIEFTPTRGPGGPEPYADLLEAPPRVAEVSLDRAPLSRSKDKKRSAGGGGGDGQGSWDAEEAVDPFFITAALAEAGVVREPKDERGDGGAPTPSDPSLVPFSLEQSSAALGALGKHTEGLNLLGFMLEALPAALVSAQARGRRPSTAPAHSPATSASLAGAGKSKPPGAGVAGRPPIATGPGAGDDYSDGEGSSDGYPFSPHSGVLGGSAGDFGSILESPGSTLRLHRPGGGRYRASVDAGIFDGDGDDAAELVRFPATLFDVLKDLYKQYDYGKLIEQRRNSQITPEKTADEYIAEMEAKMMSRRRRQSEEMERGERERADKQALSMLNNIGTPTPSTTQPRRSIPSLPSSQWRARPSRQADNSFSSPLLPLTAREVQSPRAPKRIEVTATSGAAGGSNNGEEEDFLLPLPQRSSRPPTGAQSRPFMPERVGAPKERLSSASIRRIMTDFTDYSERVLLVQMLEDCGLIFSVLGKLNDKDTERNRQGSLSESAKKPIKYERYVVRVVKRKPTEEETAEAAAAAAAGEPPSGAVVPALAEVQVLQNRLKNLSAVPAAGYKFENGNRVRALVRPGATRTVLVLEPTKKKQKVDFKDAFSFAGADVPEAAGAGAGGASDDADKEMELLQQLEDAEELPVLTNRYSSRYHAGGNTSRRRSSVASPSKADAQQAAKAEEVDDYDYDRAASLAPSPTAGRKSYSLAGSPKAPKRVARRKEAADSGDAEVAETPAQPASTSKRPTRPSPAATAKLPPVGSKGSPTRPKAAGGGGDAPFTADDDYTDHDTNNATAAPSSSAGSARRPSAKPPQRLDPLVGGNAGGGASAGEKRPVREALIDDRPVDQWGTPHPHVAEDAMNNNLVVLSALEMGDGRRVKSLEDIDEDGDMVDEEGNRYYFPKDAEGAAAAAEEEEGERRPGSPPRRDPGEIISAIVSPEAAAEAQRRRQSRQDPQQQPSTMEGLAASILDVIATEERVEGWRTSGKQVPPLVSQLVASTRLAHATSRPKPLFYVDSVGAVQPPTIVMSSAASGPALTAEQAKQFSPVGGIRYDIRPSVSASTSSPAGASPGAAAALPGGAKPGSPSSGTRPSFSMGGDANGIGLPGYGAGPGSPCTVSKTGSKASGLPAGAQAELAAREASSHSHNNELSTNTGSEADAGGQPVSQLRAKQKSITRLSAHDAATLYAKAVTDARRQSLASATAAGTASKDHLYALDETGAEEPQRPSEALVAASSPSQPPLTNPTGEQEAALRRLRQTEERARQQALQHLMGGDDSGSGGGGFGGFGGPGTPSTAFGSSFGGVAGASGTGGDFTSTLGGTAQTGAARPEVVTTKSASTGRTHVLLPPDARHATTTATSSGSGSGGGGINSTAWAATPEQAAAAAHVSDLMRAVSGGVGGGSAAGVVTKGGVGGMGGLTAGSSISGGSAGGAVPLSDMDQLQAEARELYMQDPERYAAVIDDLVRLAAERLQRDVRRFSSSALPFEPRLGNAAGTGENGAGRNNNNNNNDGQGSYGERDGYDLPQPLPGAWSSQRPKGGHHGLGGSQVSSVTLEMSEAGDSVSSHARRHDGRYSSSIPRRSVGGARRQSEVLRPASGGRLRPPPGMQHDVSEGRSEVERILFEQMQAKLLMQAVVARMRALWADKERVVETRQREAMRRTYERGMDVSWQLQKFQVINLNKLISLLDRRTHRVRGGWVPYYTDTNVLTDEQGVTEREQLLRLGGQRRLHAAMALAKRRRLLPLRLVRREVQNRWNHHLLLGYERRVLQPGSQLADAFRSLGGGGGASNAGGGTARSADLYAWQPTQRYRGRTYYPDCETREDQLRYRRRLQHAAAFQQPSMMYSPRTEREADLPYARH